ncbi:MAG TPA: hypothetical protein VIR45_06340 [Kiloniellaceae bacterium]
MSTLNFDDDMTADAGMVQQPEFRDLTPWEENGRHLEAVRDGKGWSLYLDPGDGAVMEKIATFESEEVVDLLAHYFRRLPMGD